MSKRKPRGRISIGLTERAILDLHSIESYSLATWGRRVADRYLAEVQTAIELLRTTPSLLQSDPKISNAFVFYRTGKHVLICQKFSRSICVLTILHTSMDLSSRLLELEPNLVLEAQALALLLAKCAGT